jgi:uncharacterized protein (TIGR02646 family)
MIPIQRGPEPAVLVQKRETQLNHLRSLGRPPVSKEITGYEVAKAALSKQQNGKCCYCEGKIRTSYNDVEHFRPKGMAERKPGSTERHGYWWLAYCWENLLFACPDCNRTAKKAQFPLAIGSIALKAEETPPGKEIVLLLDPASGINPAEHIQYVLVTQGKTNIPNWYAMPRNASALGTHTIEVCELNQIPLLSSRTDHIDCHVQKIISDLENAIKSRKKTKIKAHFDRACGLFQPHMPYSLFTYDVLRHHFPDQELQAVLKQSWPPPAAIGKQG